MCYSILGDDQLHRFNFNGMSFNMIYYSTHSSLRMVNKLTAVNSFFLHILHRTVTIAIITRETTIKIKFEKWRESRQEPIVVLHGINAEWAEFSTFLAFVLFMSLGILPRINNSRIETNYQSIIPAAKPHCSQVQIYSLGNQKIFESMPICS